MALPRKALIEVEAVACLTDSYSFKCFENIDQLTAIKGITKVDIYTCKALDCPSITAAIHASVPSAVVSFIDVIECYIPGCRPVETLYAVETFKTI